MNNKKNHRAKPPKISSMMKMKPITIMSIDETSPKTNIKEKYSGTLFKKKEQDCVSTVDYRNVHEKKNFLVHEPIIGIKKI